MARLQNKKGRRSIEPHGRASAYMQVSSSIRRRAADSAPSQAQAPPPKRQRLEDEVPSRTSPQQGSSAASPSNASPKAKAKSSNIPVKLPQSALDYNDPPDDWSIQDDGAGWCIIAMGGNEPPLGGAR